ncbi:MAG TPA: HAD-IIB family hydrolase [Ramlibacter sp.]|uniref:HAD family hydrolase n=1 Tax=Ramlibacter sp. TaxID=1917967 RepID=UPI002CB47987|nr:HAD-IIB family hydrolase [Ramlibacter sp.]HVZ44008.1 HAD-IIB family hydrolase [Ramlibacter sp.]
MLPLQDWPAPDRRHLIGVFTDIDDTLTTDGAITPDALQALAQLHASGVHVIPITGRPVGWSAPFATQWPVDAIVAENGAVAVLADGRKLYQQSPGERAANFERMQRVAQRILREIPGTSLARDSAGRETDIAIDHSEFAHLPQAAIEQVVALMRAEAMTATVSSIHVNAWYGRHDKFEGARWIVRERFGRELLGEIARWAYVGDSTNDVLMFERFAHSIGVANIRRFEHLLAHRPKYVTDAERGAGFAEFARAVTAAR